MRFAWVSVLAALVAAMGISGSVARSWPPLAPSSATDTAVAGMPLAAYWVADAKVQQVSEAQAALRLSCMARLGFAHVAQSLATVLPAPLHSAMAALDAGTASSSGYHSLATAPASEELVRVAGVSLDSRPETAVEWAAMYGGGATVNDRAVPEGGCFDQAQRELESSAGSIDGDPRAALQWSERMALGDPQMTAAFNRWSGCMGGRGFSYATPSDAARDSRWASASLAGVAYPGPVTAAETATASADVSCRRQVGLMGDWRAAQARWQGQIAGRERSDLAAAGSIADAWLASARRLGAVPMAAGTLREAPAAATVGSTGGSGLAPSGADSGTPPESLGSTNWQGPFTYNLLADGRHLGNSCFCQYNGDPVYLYDRFFGKATQWWVSDPVISGRRVLATAEGKRNKVYAIEDHGWSKRVGAFVDLWNWNGSTRATNEMVVISHPPHGVYPNYLVIRNAYSGLYLGHYGYGRSTYRVEWDPFCQANTMPVRCNPDPMVWL